MTLIPLFTTTSTTHAATSIPFTINTSETVNVTGTPRIAVDVGGTTRYATYTSGTGSNALTFTYTATAGDVDLDGVTLTSPIDLNGGTIKDLNGNDATLTYTLPNTSNVKINYPSLGMDFIYDSDGRYTIGNTVYNDLTSFLSAAGGTFSRASIGTYFDSAGTIQTASSGTPRFDYDPITHVAKGILIEESRTNLFTYSDQINNAAYTNVGVSVTADVTTAPNSTLSADKLKEDTSGSFHRTYRLYTLTASTPYSVSIYAKANERNWIFPQLWSGSSNVAAAWFNLSTCSVGTIAAGSADIESVGNGWCRCKIAGTSPATISGGAGLYIHVSTGNSVQSYTGDGSSSLYIWGVQMEQGSFPTSYIPTTSSTITRAVDSLSMPTGSWFTPGQGALSAEIIPNATFSNYPQIGLFGDGTSSNFIAYTLFAPSNSVIEEWKQSSSTLFAINGGLATAGSTTKFAATYNNGSSAISRNGGAAVTSGAALSTSLPITMFSIGSNIARGGTDGRYSGTIAKLKYYPARIPNAQLQLLTQ